jgi:hypothetical protein
MSTNSNKSPFSAELKVGEAKTKILKLLPVLREKGSPGLFLWGPPGIGKSAIIREICEENDLDFKDVRLSLLDPIDLRGLPMIDRENHQAKWLPPDFLPIDPDRPGILFLDELNAAPPIVQASAYQLILDKRIGNYTLPTGWVIIAAGNRDTDRAVTFTMPSALSNRFMHLELTCEIGDWKEWAYKTGIHDAVIGFLSYKPQYLFDFQPNYDVRTFATPRSWAFVSQVVKNSQCVDYLSNYIPALIGEKIAAEFVPFFKLHKNVPKIEPILNGTDFKIPENLSITYLLIGGLINQYRDKPSKTYQENLVRYMLRLPVEFGVLLAKDLVRVDPTVTMNKEFVNWAGQNKDIFSMI